MTSASRNFSTVLAANHAVDGASSVSRASVTARTAPPVAAQQGGWSGARRPTSAAPVTQTAAAAAAAAVSRRALANPRARAQDTRDIGIGPCPGQDGVVKRVPFSVESVLPPVPQSFKCPITHEVMRDPVMTQDGHVYESDAIQEWFRRGHRTSPVTGAELINLALLPEVPLRRAIEEYMALRPEIARKELTLRSDLLTQRGVVEKLEQELKLKDKMLRDMGCTQRAEASASSTNEACSSSSTSSGALEFASHSQPGADKGSSPEKMGRPAHLNVPTPCRDGRGRKPHQASPEPSQPTQPTTGRTNKLQELIKAMSWRGRATQRRTRARSQDPDARY